MERRDKKKASLEKREDFFFLLREIEKRGDINRRDREKARRRIIGFESVGALDRWISFEFDRFEGEKREKRKKKGEKREKEDGGT